MTSLSLKYQLRSVKQFELRKLEVGSECNVLVINEVELLQEYLIRLPIKKLNEVLRDTAFMESVVSDRAVRTLLTIFGKA